MEPGTLYVVATPIGNLRDITLRALDVLRGVDAVVAEDTRRTKQLLAAHDIHKPLYAMPAYDEAKRAGSLLEKLQAGMSLAICTDAGTPAISDPGAHLVRAALTAKVKVIPIPGPSALVTAISASGLAADKVFFLGFGPRVAGKRRRLLENLLTLEATLVLYESPYRLLKLMQLLCEIAPRHEIVVARELTKLHETFHRGTAAELAAYFGEHPPKGECTVLIGGRDD